MNLPQKIKQQLHVHRQFAVQFLGSVVSLHGLYILAVTLLVQIGVHRTSRLSTLAVDLPLFIGLSLIYLGALLRRHKRTAWTVTVGVYATYLFLGLAQISGHRHSLINMNHVFAQAFAFPIIVLVFLIIFRKEYIVKSDIQGFGFAARFSLIVFLVAFLYGIAGFLLLDHTDFHQEIGPISAAHYTIDQFNLTTNKPLKPYTRRAHLFVDSLSVVSFGAIAYAALSLFQPLKFKFVDQNHERQRLRELLEKHGSRSEDFFKLWPHDKQYIFDQTGSSVLAFRVNRGVALCLSDPAGLSTRFPNLMQDFSNLCFGNDWLPALIHVEDKNRRLYEKYGYTMQRLGQEAVLDLQHFTDEVTNQKYFRQIRNKFAKRDYSYELLSPPHHEAVINRLKIISDEWLGQGGRAERGFVMGYFTPEYVQQCDIIIARDAAGTIQAFANLVPASFDKEEATYDMLRQSNNSLGNINDYLLMSLIGHLKENSYKRLNLGLCPLAGLDLRENEEQNKIISGVLGFAYANGDRLYSFQGLYKFKAKYEPVWRDRYVAYQGGLRGFAKTTSALMRAMKI